MLEILKHWWCGVAGHYYEPWGYADGKVVALECARCGHIKILRPTAYKKMMLPNERTH